MLLNASRNNAIRVQRLASTVLDVMQQLGQFGYICRLSLSSSAWTFRCRPTPRWAFRRVFGRDVRLWLLFSTNRMSVH